MRALVVLVALTLPAAADPKITTQSTPIYPSKLCKEKGKAGEGQDPVLTCPAPTGYTVTVFFSAENTYAEIGGTPKQLQVGGKKVGGQIEWRLVDGKPFAIIVSVDKKLLVRTLDGALVDEVDEKKADAWKQARNLADASLKKK
jgi:hypothetical protein